MTSTSAKARCVKCEKNIGQFKCEGCSQRFCIIHIVEHRQILNQQLEEITLQHNTLQGAAKEKNSQVQSLIASIEQWEQKSIEKIRQMANDTRQKVVQLGNADQKKVLSQELENLAKQMKTAHEEDDFFENELRHWASSIEKVRPLLQTAALSADMKENKTMPLVYGIQIVSSPPKVISLPADITNEAIYDQIEYDTVVSNEKFDGCYGNAKIEHHGQIVTNGTNSFIGTEIRGKLEYSSGIHNFRLQIENNPSKIWVFIGIISKEAQMGGNLFTSSSVYGWGDYNDYFLAGQRQKTSSDVVFTHTRENDVIQLILDCTKNIIRYKNERTQQSEELSVDMNKCSFPWQLYLSLGGRGDRIRLLNHATAC